MLSIFRKNNKEKLKKEGKDSTVSSEEIVNETDQQTAPEEKIDTELSFHPSWDVPAEQTYVYRFLNNELEPLKPNQISLAGIELRMEEGQAVAIAFMRNSLNKGITFEKVTLLLLDEQEEMIARHEFDLSELGEIPGRSSRPWQFVFPASSLRKQEFSTSGWKIAFEIKQKHSLDLEDSWNSSLSTEDKDKLKNLIDKLDPPKEGEVNFMGLQASLRDNGDFHVTVLIRNGSPKNINIQQLPLQVTDAAGDLVAKGGFQLNDLQIKANTTKPWTFIFPASLVLKQNPDLSKWTAAAVQG